MVDSDPRVLIPSAQSNNTLQPERANLMSDISVTLPVQAVLGKGQAEEDASLTVEWDISNPAAVRMANVYVSRDLLDGANSTWEGEVIRVREEGDTIRLLVSAFSRPGLASLKYTEIVFDADDLRMFLDATYEIVPLGREYASQEAAIDAVIDDILASA